MESNDIPPIKFISRRNVNSARRTLQDSILFFGDFVCNGDWKRNPIHDSVKNIASTSDISCLNLEAPISVGHPIKKSGPVISTDKDALNAISTTGFDLACLANNHAMDYGALGLNKTMEICSRESVETVGAGMNISKATEPFYREGQNGTIAIVNVCQHEFGISSPNQPGVAPISGYEICGTIEEACANADHVIAVVHGGSEYLPMPSIRWQYKLRDLVNCGVDAIIGHHPHVPQGWEIYKNRPIFYSLGNFVFDQRQYDANRWSFGVKFELSPTGIDRILLIMLERHDRQMKVMGRNRDPSPYKEYLKEVSNLTGKSPKNPGYWQSIAYDRYKSKYERFYRRLGGGDPVSILKSPLSEMGRIIKSIARQSEADLTEREVLTFLNFIRAEAHRNVTISGLELESGAEIDHRSFQTKLKTDSMLDFIRNGPTDK